MRRKAKKKDAQKDYGVLKFVSILSIMVGYFLWERQALTSFSSKYMVVDSKASTSTGDLPIKRSTGENWKVWKSTTEQPLFSDQYECKWTQYTPKYNSSKSAKMCVHTDLDIISNAILTRGYWEDCVALPRQWYQETNSTTNTVHLEIGANIGACILELLLTSDARVVAFEPHPKNLFCLTSTLSANPELGKRVTLFPIALGETQTSTVIQPEEKSNYGSSRLGGSLADKDSFPVQVERLDDIIEAEDFRLIKMDAQGYECSIMDGAKEVFSKTRRIFSEVESSNLEQVGCSRAGFVERLNNRGFEVKHYRASGKLNPMPPPTQISTFNIVALRP